MAFVGRGFEPVDLLLRSLELAGEFLLGTGRPVAATPRSAATLMSRVTPV
jgi:hypothetical protein